MRVGPTVRALRNNLDLSCAALSRRADIHVNSLYKIEDDLTSPSVKMLDKVARAMHLKNWEVLRAAEDEKFFEIIAARSASDEVARDEMMAEIEREWLCLK